MRNAGEHLSFDHALRDRVRRRGGDPLLTYYAPSSGVRIELSPRTFVNWVDKTANLLVDELDLAEGDSAVLPLAVAHPGHWTTLVWIAALWQVGVLVRGPGAVVAAGSPDLVVTGPEEYEHDFPGARALGARAVVACSLHPFGLGFPGPTSPGVLDFGADVPSQPDVYIAAPATPGAPLWQDSERTLDWAGVRDAAGSLLAADGTYGRRTVLPTAAYPTLLTALVGPVLGDGSAVIIDGPVEDRAVAEISAAERSEA
ncbi:TIGR03089 family protein [Raineyella antarctica]|uniref:TIGR03089 family protein n=1 Tax=Raineyella antarctica TaxID=1577474 RepID=A0A1G6H455_9ACTN|nr:TIGR03089 family protein [Raineyella antarctica]SDB89069.1 TIGR03089 family protein [Raineyella antarctica]